jgi:CYTH domain-containing protein
MTSTRVFLLASGLARLIERERAGNLVWQGYFPEHPDRRSTHVQLTGVSGHLVLASHSAKGPLEAAAEISPRQAEALLALCAGRVEYLSIAIDIASHAASIQRFVTPGPLDLISMAFRDDKTARKFHPPAWFGPEVSADPHYRLRSIALAGQPAMPEVEVTNAALIGLLDALDHRDQEAEPRPTGRVQAATPPEVPFDAEAEQELDGLKFEDSVIRDLARALQPQGR